MGLKEASTLAKTSSIGPCVSTEHQLVTDRDTDTGSHMGVRTRGKWGQLTPLEKWMKN